MDERDRWLETAMTNYEEPLLRLCFAALGDAALAEDAVQDIFEGMARLWQVPWCCQ